MAHACGGGKRKIADFGTMPAKEKPIADFGISSCSTCTLGPRTYFLKVGEKSPRYEIGLLSTRVLAWFLVLLGGIKRFTLLLVKVKAPSAPPRHHPARAGAPLLERTCVARVGLVACRPRLAIAQDTRTAVGRA